MDKIAAHSGLCAVGVLLLHAIVHADPRIRNVAFAIVLDVLALDENDSIGAFADAGDVLSKASKFLHVGFAPQFLVLGVHQ